MNEFAIFYDKTNHVRMKRCSPQMTMKTKGGETSADLPNLISIFIFRREILTSPDCGGLALIER